VSQFGNYPFRGGIAASNEVGALTRWVVAGAVEEYLEAADDLLNSAGQISERASDRSSIRGWSVLERYVYGEAAVCVQIQRLARGNRSGHEETQNCLAVFDLPVGLVQDLLWIGQREITKGGMKNHRHVSTDRVSVAAHIGNRESRRAVLVPVPEFIQQREAGSFGAPSLPRRERLFRLNERDQARLNALEGSKRAAFPGVFSLEDGKLHLPPPASAGEGSNRDLSLVLHGERPNKLVERRPQVVNNVSRDDPEFYGWERFEDEDSDINLASIRPWLGLKGVGLVRGVEEMRDSRIQFADVMLRPLDFQAGATGVQPHEA
jgi:hypothetical protein